MPCSTKAQREIDDKAIVIIAKRQPMADDLREIIGAIRISADLERVGDLGKNIAKRVVAVTEGRQPPSLFRGLQALAELALTQLKEVLDVYASRSVERIGFVRDRDEQIDAMYTSLFRELLTYMMEDPRNITACTHLLFCAKNIERIGDHATNIAETVYYIVTGKQMPPERPKEDRSHRVTISARPIDASRRRVAAADAALAAARRALRRRLEGDARVIGAVRAALGGIVAAEVEIFRQRIAVRPFAGALVELDQLQVARDRHDDVLDRPQHVPGDRLGVELGLQRGRADRRRSSSATVVRRGRAA